MSDWCAPSTTPPRDISSMRSEAAVVPMSSGTISGSEVCGEEDEEVDRGGGRTCGKTKRGEKNEKNMFMLCEILNLHNKVEVQRRDLWRMQGGSQKNTLSLLDVGCEMERGAGGYRIGSVECKDCTLSTEV